MGCHSLNIVRLLIIIIIFMPCGEVKAHYVDKEHDLNASTKYVSEIEQNYKLLTKVKQNFELITEAEQNNERLTKDEGNTDDNITFDEAYEKIYDSLRLDNLNLIYNSVTNTERLDVDRLLNEVARGNIKYAFSVAIKTIRENISLEIISNRALMLELITIVLIGSVFINISNSFGQSFISENGFYVTYLIMTAIMLSAFAITMDMVAASLDVILKLIRGIVPIYALAINYAGYTTQAAGMYQIILLLVWFIQVIIIRLILPMIKFYVIISMVNNFNKEDNFSRLCQLIKNIVSWLLKTIVIFVAGLNLIKSLIEPQIDGLSKNLISRVSSIIPGGGVMSVLTGTFLGAGIVIKNSIGVVGILLLGLAVLTPIIKLLIIMLVIKITGAMIQPVGDKRYIAGFDAMGKGIGLLMQVISSSVVMFMLTIAIVAFSGRGI